MEIIDTQKIFLPSGRNITVIDAATPLKKHKNSYQKYGGISLLRDIATAVMSASVELEKIRTKLTLHWWKSIKRKDPLYKEVLS